MSNLSQSISAVCHQLIEKPTNLKVNHNLSYQKALNNALNDTSLPQEVVLSKMDSDFYVNLKKKINIKLFRELNIELKFNDMDKEVYAALYKESQVVKDGNRNHVAMQTGDIEIKFNDTSLSKEISENEIMQKNWAIIKWEKCFIERVSPWWRDGERYALIEATQDDLKKILIWLTELL